MESERRGKRKIRFNILCGWERQQRWCTLYKATSFFFLLLFFFTRNARMGKVRMSRTWPWCTHTHTHTHTLSRTQGRRWNLSAFRLCSALVKIILGLYNFPGTLAILVVTISAYTLHVQTLPSSMLPTQFTRHYHRSPLSPLSHLRPVHFRKQVYFQLFFCIQRPTLLARHPRKLHGIFARIFARCLL